jgi:hypothetical protein
VSHLPSPDLKDKKSKFEKGLTLKTSWEVPGEQFSSSLENATDNYHR